MKTGDPIAPASIMHLQRWRSSRTVSVLFNPKTAPQSAYYLKLLEAAALSLALKLKVVQVSNAGEIEAEIDQLAQQSNAGLVVLPDIFTAAQALRDLIVARTAQNRIPTIYSVALFARAGGLVSHGFAGRTP